MAEVVRGALQAIPRTQIEAGRSIGLTFPRILLYVLLPQALRQILPVWINTGAELVKASSLLSVIGVGELLLKTQEVVGRNFMTLEFYALCGLLYFTINFGIEHLGRWAERRLYSRNA
jgi:polar amino acid transport system permease protein